MANSSKRSNSPDYYFAETEAVANKLAAMSSGPSVRPDPARVAKAQLAVEEIKRMTAKQKLDYVRTAREEGYDWVQAYEHIRQIVDPMDVMSDTQIFGVELPWDLWRR